MSANFHQLLLRADQSLHLGAGKGAGYSSTTLTYIPSATLIGAFAGAWWRDHPQASQADFQALLTAISISDAIVAPTAPTDGSQAVAEPVALDRLVCKYPGQACPSRGYPWWQVRHQPGCGPDCTAPLHTGTCPTCQGVVGQGRGARDLPDGRVLPTTRVALDWTGRAMDDHLYARAALSVPDDTLTAWVSGTATDLDRMGIRPGAVIRAGAARSVAGRLTVTAVTRHEDQQVLATSGYLRIELISKGVFVDQFGFAASRPTTGQLAHALGLVDRGPICVARSWTRWTTAGGWHARADRPKAEDPAVIPHSVYVVQVPRGSQVPGLIRGLGLRTFEGCGWATVSPLPDGAVALLQAGKDGGLR